MFSPSITKLERDARSAIDRLSLAQMSADDFAELELRLLDDAEFRRVYVEQAELEAELEHHLRGSPVISIAAESWSQRRWPLAWATALSVLLIASVANLFWIDSLREAILGGPMVDYTESSLIGSRPVAIVTQKSDAADHGTSALKVGDRIKPGALRLNRGQMQLELVNGVRLQVVGPAEVHLLSEMEATLIRGQASVVTPPHTPNFYLNGPISAIISGSSEFVYRVKSDDVGSLDVYHGEVMASILGNRGDTLLNELVMADQTATFDGNQLDVTDATFLEADRVLVMPVDDVSLNATHRYAELVQQDDPLVYWRFEEDDVEGDLVRNHVSDRYLGRLHSTDGEGMSVDRGTLHFGPSEDLRYLKLNEPIQELNQGEFTVELWVRARRLHWGTFLGILPVKQRDTDQETHLCLLEYANKTNLVHRPATVRFLYRYPAKSFSGGLNSFSSNACIPGLWTHIVGVKTHQGTKLFVNGDEIMISDELQFSDDMSYTVVVGQLDSVRPMRQFEGQIDEIAIYGKALTPEQIRRHYQAMTGPPQT